MIEAVVLDFFGTVVHEAHAVLDRIAQVFRADGAAADRAAIGGLWWKYFAAACDAAHGAAFRRQKELYVPVLAEMERETGARIADKEALARELIEFSRSAEPYGDALRFLERCPLPCYILSNIDTEELRAVMDYRGIRVRGIYTSEMAGEYKPRRGIFEKGLRAFGLVPERCLYVGDSLRNDYGGAQGAGMCPIWLNRLGAETPQGVRAVESFDALFGDAFSD